MISAIQTPNATPSFTSTIPVKVHIDGMETFNPKYIKQSCQQLGTVLSGLGKTQKPEIMRKFASYDPHYVLDAQGNFVQPRRPWAKGSKPTESDFFRKIIDEHKNATFLFTGPQSMALGEQGYAMGLARKTCKTLGIAESKSFDLMLASNKYKELINDFINSAKYRLLGNIEGSTKKVPLDLNISMTSNKKYNQKSFKIDLEDIYFTPSKTI